MLAAAALAFSAQGPPPGVDAELQARINGAIERGADALLRAQELDGSWRTNVEDFGTGMTALATYTLIKCGVAPAHPALGRAFHFLRSRETTKTYSMACLILAIVGRGDPADRAWLEECAATLSDWETSGYAYPDGAVDLSNTSYAALALYAAGEAGVRIPDKTWRGVAEFALACRERAGERKGAVTGGDSAPAGFGYQPVERNPSGSMTASAVAVMAMAERRLKPFPAEMARARAQGLSWLAANFTVEHNPMRERGSGKWLTEDGHHLYYLYALERACALAEVAELGGRHWYAEGARWLVEHQEHTGNWQSNQPNTCFALLFLARATSGGRSAVTPAESAPEAASEDEPSFAGEVDLRVRSQAPAGLWIGGLAAAVVKDFDWPEDAEPLPRILEVRWYARPPQGRRALLARTFGSDAESLPLRRFAAPIAPDRIGAWTFQAEVDLLPPGEVPEPETIVTLVSAEVGAEFLDVADAARDAYAAEAILNLLVPARPTLTASSQADEGYFAVAKAADGLQGTGWRSADADPRPWLRIELGRAVRADRLLLSHWYDFRTPDPAHCGRALRVELLLNGEKRGIEADLNPDHERKTAIPLPAGKAIRSLEIRVLAAAPGRDGADGVGFNEVELLRDR